MNIREVRTEDGSEIERLISQHNFPYPEGPVITKAIVEKDGKVVAFGLVRFIAEEIMIMDQDCSDRDKSEILQLLHKQAIQGCLTNGIEEIHAFVQDEHFIEVLKKHYGYKDCKGKAIVMVF